MRPVPERRDGGGIGPAPPPGRDVTSCAPDGRSVYRAAGAGGTVAGLAGACSPDADAAFTLDELRTAGETCPVDLAARASHPTMAARA